MIDTFSLLLSHTLLFVACWRMLSRVDLDDERQETTRPLVNPRNRTPPDA